MKTVFRKIHLWLALPAGIVITIICLTGAILVFRNEIIQITGSASVHEDAFISFVTSLHRWLMDDSKTIGKLIVGISTCFFVFILFSGLGIYWRKVWKRDNFIVHRSKGINRLVFDLHAVLAMYAGIILLMCALTGLMWAFQWYRDAVGFIFDTPVNRGAPIWDVVKAIHFGSYLGIFSKIITACAALVGASLPITGYWMYIRKLKRHNS